MAKQKTLRPIKATRKREKAYEKEIDQAVLKPLLSNITERLRSVPPIKVAWEQSVIQEFEIAIAERTLGEKVATESMDSLRLWHKDKTARAFKAALGIDVNIFGSELGIRPTMEAAIAENIGLIKKIPSDMLPKLQKQFRETFDTAAFDQQKFIDILEKQFKVGKNRAKFIARDQTSKVIGNLNQARQTGLGVDSYKWRNMQDIAVVGNPAGLYPRGTQGHMNHWIREGETFFWNDPPEDGHPGQAFNCRCFAEGIIPEG